MMNNIRELICIGCPMGCAMQIELEDDKVINVTGNLCKRGETYGEKECTNPTRIITSSVEVEGGEFKTVPIKTERDIPKEKIYQCIQLLKGIKVKAPVNIGDVIIENVGDTGVNIIATRKVEAV